MQVSVLFILGVTSLFLSTAATAQQNTLASAGKNMPANMVAMNTASATATTTPAVLVAAPTEAKSFKGVVVDELGDPLAGAVVSIISGTNQFSVATTTNAEGEYVISSTSAAPMLLATYAGYTNIQQKATYGYPVTFQMEWINNYDRKLKKQAKSAGKAWRE